MSTSDRTGRAPIRREPPPFRRVAVRDTEELTPRMRRVVLGGRQLAGFEISEAAASVRLLLPTADGDLQMPIWTGNQFQLADGSRAPIRTFTPRHFDHETLDLTLDIVVHDGGAASRWASSVAVGRQAAVSGPGRGYRIDPTASGYLLAGDETALPAIAQLLEALPDSMPVRVVIEIVDRVARPNLPVHTRVEDSWHVLSPGDDPGTALVDAITSLEDMPPAVWVAGEAASVRKIRNHLFEERGLARSAATVRGYWKHGRAA